MGHTVQNIHSYQLTDVILVTTRIKADNYYTFFPKLLCDRKIITSILSWYKGLAQDIFFTSRTANQIQILVNLNVTESFLPTFRDQGIFFYFFNILKGYFAFLLFHSKSCHFVTLINSSKMFGDL